MSWPRQVPTVNGFGRAMDTRKRLACLEQKLIEMQLALTDLPDDWYTPDREPQ